MPLCCADWSVAINGHRGEQSSGAEIRHECYVVCSLILALARRQSPTLEAEARRGEARSATGGRGDQGIEGQTEV